MSCSCKAGNPQVEHLNQDQKLSPILENHLILINSKISRNSGINNWEVYKNFFDDKSNVRTGLAKINSLTKQAYTAIKNKNFEVFLNLIIKEGEVRKSLFEGIEVPKVSDFLKELQEKFPKTGSKICGAGGGGCFLVVLPDLSLDTSKIKEDIQSLCQKHSMEILDFNVAPIV